MNFEKVFDTQAFNIKIDILVLDGTHNPS